MFSVCNTLKLVQLWQNLTYRNLFGYDYDSWNQWALTGPVCSRHSWHVTEMSNWPQIIC